MLTSTNTSYYSSYTSDTSATTGYLKGGDTSTDTTTTESTSDLGKDDFLTLLLAELKNQDPLSPADNTEFVAQLAQFSSLEQLVSMNTSLADNLESGTQNAESIRNSMMINYVGKDVSAESDTFIYNGDDAVDLTFTLSDDSVDTELEIKDENGSVVRLINLGEMSAGVNSIQWDGETNLGSTASQGTYTCTITTTNVLGEETEYTPVFTGTVQGIAFKDDIAYINLGEVLVPFSSISSVSED